MVMKNTIRFLAAAAACLLFAGNAFAAGMYVPDPNAQAPGAPVTAGFQPGEAAIVSSPDSNEPIRILDRPAAGPSAAAQTAPETTAPQSAATANGSGTAQAQSAASSDEAELLARSLREPYTLFPTSDPDIFISRGRKIDRRKPLVAMTYDDGPQTEAGGRILNAFLAQGQRATFFMVGDRISSRASEVKRMTAEGHEVANHTWDHTLLNGKSAETVQNQISKCNNTIESVSGVKPRLMRLPGGSGAKSSTVLGNVGMPIILWNIDTRDWEHRNAQKTINAVSGKVKDGDVVLMHELYGATAEATEYLVPELVRQGFELVTVSEMAALKGISLQNRVYYSF